MDKYLDLNTSASLPDRTASAQAGATGDAAGGASASDIKRGFSKPSLERTAPYDPETTGENVVSDAGQKVGVCGRPQGWAR